MTAEPVKPTPEPSQQDRDEARAIPVWDRDPRVLHAEIAEAIARARAAGAAAERERCARVVMAEATNMGAACARSIGSAEKYEYAQDRLLEVYVAIRSLAPEVKP